MPAKSVAARRAAAIAEHHPEKLYKRNRGLLGMDQGELHKFASTDEAGLPAHARKRRPRPSEIDKQHAALGGPR